MENEIYDEGGPNPDADLRNAYQRIAALEAEKAELRRERHLDKLPVAAQPGEAGYHNGIKVWCVKHACPPNECEKRHPSPVAEPTEAAEGTNPDNYVAWMRFRRREDNGHTYITVCDSDTPGAFRVYRHPAPPPELWDAVKELRNHATWHATMEFCEKCFQATEKVDRLMGVKG